MDSQLQWPAHTYVHNKYNDDLIKHLTKGSDTMQNPEWDFVIYHYRVSQILLSNIFVLL